MWGPTTSEIYGGAAIVWGIVTTIIIVTGWQPLWVTAAGSAGVAILSAVMWLDHADGASPELAAKEVPE